MNNLNLITHSPEQTHELGRSIGKLVQHGDVILLTGELGTGKTCLTQGIAWGLGIEEYTLSPTFVIMREMRGRLPLYHVDLYRLDDIKEIADLGLDDYLYGNGVCVVEWAEKGLSIMPGEHLLVEISHLGEDERSFQLRPGNQHYQDMLEQLTETMPEL
jgi:tRNA threonylcarbamoyladenosine biosynthesis protein TsaE